MKSGLLFIILMLISLDLCAYADSDMDGVEDGMDRCPNTSLSELVDISGCPTKNLLSPHFYDVIVGLDYSDSDYRSVSVADTFSSSLQVDYHYKQFSFQASTSYFNTLNNENSYSGLYDSFIGASYRLKKIDSLSITFGTGVILPTYDTELNNNEMDYTVSTTFSYAFENIDIFGSYAYTLVNDDDVGEISYKNTNAFSVGAGRYVNSKLYMSFAYNLSDSVYNGMEDMRSISAYGYYTIGKNLFSTLNYARGLSDTASKNYVSIRLGYFF